MPDYVITGPTAQTATLASSDSVQTLPSSVLEDSYGRPAAWATVQCETNEVRYALGVDPDRTTPLGFKLPVGGSVELEGPQEISNFRFTNSSSGQNGRIQYQVMYLP